MNPNDTPKPCDPAWSKTNQFLLGTGEKLKMNQYWYSSVTIDAMVKEIERVATKVCFLSTPSLYFSLKNQTIRDNSSLFDFDDVWKDEPGYFKYDFNHPEDIPQHFHHQFDYVVIDPPFVTEEVWKLYADATKLLLVEGAIDTVVKPSSQVAKPAADTAAAEADVEKKAAAETAINPFASSNKTGNSPKAAKTKAVFGFAAAINNSEGRDVRMEVQVGDAVLRGRPEPKGRVMLTTIVENDWLLFDALGVCPRRFRPSIPNLIYQYSLYLNYPAPALDVLNEEIDACEPPGNSRKPCKYGGMGGGGGDN